MYTTSGALSGLGEHYIKLEAGAKAATFWVAIVIDLPSKGKMTTKTNRVYSFGAPPTRISKGAKRYSRSTLGLVGLAALRICGMLNCLDFGLAGPCSSVNVYACISMLSYMF